MYGCVVPRPHAPIHPRLVTPCPLLAVVHFLCIVQVSLVSTVPLDDQVLTGVQFCKGSRGHPIIATSYDNNVIPVVFP